MIGLGWDNDADLPFPQIAAHSWTAIALIAGDPLRPDAWATLARPLDSASLHQQRQHRLLVTLTPRQQEDYWLAARLAPKMDFRAVPAAARVQRLGLRIPLGSSGVLVRSDYRAIHDAQRPGKPALHVGLPLHVGQKAIPDASVLPPVEARRHRLPRAISVRQDSPRTTGTQDPEDAVDNRPVIAGWTTGTGFLRGQQRAEPVPLCIRQFANVPCLRG